MFVIAPGLLTTANDSTLKWYKKLQSLASHCAQSFEDLNNTTNMQVRKKNLLVNGVVCVHVFLLCPPQLLAPLVKTTAWSCLIPDYFGDLKFKIHL